MQVVSWKGAEISWNDFAGRSVPVFIGRRCNWINKTALRITLAPVHNHTDGLFQVHSSRCIYLTLESRLMRWIVIFRPIQETSSRHIRDIRWKIETSSDQWKRHWIALIISRTIIAMYQRNQNCLISLRVNRFGIYSVAIGAIATQSIVWLNYIEG